MAVKAGVSTSTMEAQKEHALQSSSAETFCFRASQLTFAVSQKGVHAGGMGSEGVAGTGLRRSRTGVVALPIKRWCNSMAARDAHNKANCPGLSFSV